MSCLLGEDLDIGQVVSHPTGRGTKMLVILVFCLPAFIMYSGMLRCRGGQSAVRARSAKETTVLRWARST